MENWLLYSFDLISDQLKNSVKVLYVHFRFCNICNIIQKHFHDTYCIPFQAVSSLLLLWNSDMTQPINIDSTFDLCALKIIPIMNLFFLGFRKTITLRVYIEENQNTWNKCLVSFCIFNTIPDYYFSGKLEFPFLLWCIDVFVALRESGHSFCKDSIKDLS